MEINDYEKYISKYKQTIPSFVQDPHKLDIYPILAYFRIVETLGVGEGIIRLGPIWYFDTYTGYLVRLVEKQANRKAKKFYSEIFPNKRRGKRYVFGLKGDNKTTLAAICTHISAINEKHSNRTSRYLQLALPHFKKSNSKILNITLIDKIIFPFIGTKEYAKHAKINWYRYYMIGFKLGRFFK